jgi:hypothetical protein
MAPCSVIGRRQQRPDRHRGSPASVTSRPWASRDQRSEGAATGLTRLPVLELEALVCDSHGVHDARIPELAVLVIEEQQGRGRRGQGAPMT